MRKVLVLFAFLLNLSASAQILKPISWQVELSPKNPNAGDVAEIQFKSAIDDNWYLYSNDFDPDLGPMLTEFFFNENETYELVGEVTAINPKKKYDSAVWMGEYTYFSGKGLFTQKVKILNKDFSISGNYTYQVCSDLDGKCIPFDDDFSLGKKKDKEEKTTGASEADSAGLLEKRDPSDPYSLLSFMIAAFLFGLAALLTPCVFPMIPMTVTYFAGKDNKKKGRVRNSLIYGASIIVIYVFIGSIVAPFMGPETANDLATGWIPNVIFFTVFVVFALSFLGLFEINLPNSFVNRVDAMGDKGGLIGVFFMALTLVLVSFSCTGPLVGSILVESAGGMVVKPILGMLAFSAAFAIPFTLFALFPGWLSTLPKSGGWLNSVKVVLGFLELAFAFKFLSIADQAYHWNILDREVYLAIWIVIFSLMGFYLLGKLKLPGDDDSSRTSVPKLMLAILTFSFVTYMIPGMFGAPLSRLAGYLPPQTTLDFDLTRIVREGATIVKDNEICEDPLYTDFLHLPHGLKGYFDYNQAISCAKEQGKPLFIDFTGHGCVNCREMEQRVWSDPKVLSRLNEKFVIVALYVDDKTELTKNDWYTSSYDNKVKKTIGKQNADFQITRFNNNAQPFYVILNEEGKLLVEPKAYDLNIGRFVEFLDEALENHRKNAVLQLD
ncbi:MAG: cytochrome c biogenesis protein CcdA [Cyclobacteriaceae bacterium]